MDQTDRVLLAGSERSAAPGARVLGAVRDDEAVQVTVVLRRKSELPIDVLEGKRQLSRDELRAGYGADPGELRQVVELLEAAGAQVLEQDPGSRRVVAVGPAGELSRLFGTALQEVETTNPVTGATLRHRQRTGSLSVPSTLAGIVTAVLGLDDRPQARPHLRPLRPEAAATSFTADQVAELYEFPPGTDGSGQVVAVVELGGGLSQSDLANYFSQLGITAPKVQVVSVDGAASTAGADPGADIEVSLDVEVIGAAAPGVSQVVYFAPNTDAGFHDALAEALQGVPTPVAVSISWGESEDSWSAQGRSAIEQACADAVALGVTVMVAAGDSGSSDGVNDGLPHVDFPASCPYVLGCGGTRLDAGPAAATIASEVVWDDLPNGGATGGGVSDVYALPSWQKAASEVKRAGTGTFGRGVPDVAGDAAPQSGYRVLCDGTEQVVGGTSAVAPLWAALTARLAQGLERSPGWLAPALYAGVEPGAPAEGFRDITSGNNGAYQAGPGWDACSGLGSPVGTSIAARLRGAASAAGALQA